jgi:hypothetical protein
MTHGRPLSVSMIARETVRQMWRRGLIKKLHYELKEDHTFNYRTDTYKITVWCDGIPLDLEYDQSCLFMCLDDFAEFVVEPAVREYALGLCQYDDAGQII